MSNKTLFCLACEMPLNLCGHKKGKFQSFTTEEFVALLGRKPRFLYLTKENQKNLKTLFDSLNK